MPSRPDGAAARAVVDDVDVIEPEGRLVSFRGQNVRIVPMTVGKIPRVTRALRGVSIQGTDPAALMELVAEHGDQVLEAAAHATGLPLSEIQEATLPEFIELFATLIEVNAAFFTQAVTRLLGTLGGFGDGPTSSTGSSSPAIASTTYADTP